MFESLVAAGRCRGRHPPRVTAAASAELRELKRRNRMLEQENKILWRAAAFFAKEIARNDAPAGP
ncbi:MAG: hypothetical protein GEV00_20305 [Actinophytocola sp.]|nr:hypothetical protein [Actinophytocola sp.]